VGLQRTTTGVLRHLLVIAQRKRIPGHEFLMHQQMDEY